MKDAHGLNPQQLAVVSHGDGPCLVLAGAGSGKTRTVVYRVARLIADGVAPEQILLLTFTNKAAREMMARIETLLAGQSVGQPVGGTFHSVANRILRDHAERIGYTRSFTIIDQDDGKSLIKACMKELGIDAKAKRFPSPGVLQSLFSLARNAMTTVERAVLERQPSFAAFTADIVRAFDAYQKRKRQANAMDFDDLLVRWHELMLKEPAVRAQLNARFRHVLVDEYQDTNAIQAAIVRSLAGDAMNVCAVGDDCQSIYSFRAADIRNILEFPHAFPGAKTYMLEVNYRSSPEIVAVANEAIANNPKQFPKELRSAGESGEKPIVHPAPSAVKEAEFVADEIARLADDEGVPMREMAVLFRATHHSQAIEFELMRRGIAYEYRGGMRFFERAHTKDALAFLRIVDNAADEAAWLRALSIQVGIGDVAAAKAVAAVRAVGSLEAAVSLDGDMLGSRAKEGWNDLRQTLEKLVLAPRTPTDILRALMKTPYVDYLQAEYPDALDRIGDIEQLAVFAETYADIGSFLAEATLDDSAFGPSAGRERGDRRPKLVLSTIHQAKGLEWDAVFVVHLSGSAFPNRRAALEEGGIEEERRLFYVAVTRARRRLYLSYPLTTSRDMFGMEQPSMFLDELPQRLVDWHGRDGRARDFDDSVSRFLDDDGVVLISEDGERRDNGAPPTRRSFLRDV